MPLNEGEKDNWWVVLTLLKNISQWEGLSHILWKKMFQTTNQMLAINQYAAIGTYCFSTQTEVFGQPTIIQALNLFLAGETTH